MKTFPLLLCCLLLLPGALQAGSYARISQRFGDLPAELVIDEQTGGQARAASTATRPEVRWLELPEPHYVTNQVALVNAIVSNHVIRLDGDLHIPPGQHAQLELEGRTSGSFQFTGVSARLYAKYRVQRVKRRDWETETPSSAASASLSITSNEVVSLQHNQTERLLRRPCDAVAAGCDWQDPEAFTPIWSSPGSPGGGACIADARYRRSSQIVAISPSAVGTEGFYETPCSLLEFFSSSQIFLASPTTTAEEVVWEDSLTETLETGWIRIDPGREATFTFRASHNLSASSTNEVSGDVGVDDTLTLSLLLATEGELDPQAAGGFWHAAPPAGMPVSFTTVTGAEVVSPGPSREFVHSTSGNFSSSSGEVVTYSQVLTSVWSAPPDSTGKFVSSQTSLHSGLIDMRPFQEVTTDTKLEHTSNPNRLFRGHWQFNSIEDVTMVPSPLSSRAFNTWHSLSRDQIQVETIATLNPGIPTYGTWYVVSEQTSCLFRLPKPSWVVFLAVCAGEEFSARLSEGDVNLLSDSRIFWDERLLLPPGEYFLTSSCDSSPTIFEGSLHFAIDPLGIAGITPSANGVELYLDRLLVGEEVVLEALEAGAESAAVEIARFVPTQSTHRVTWPVPPGDAPMLFRLRQTSGPSPTPSGSVP